MQLGFIGSGNMARSLALGLGESALFSDSGSGRARLLAQQTDGADVETTELADRADAIFLCHKPRQLQEVSVLISEFSGTIISVLAATPLSALREAYPNASVIRTMPNIPVEFGEGVFAVAAESDDVPEVMAMFDRLGLVVQTPEEHFEVVTAIGGCAPAFFALFARELISAAVERGLHPAQAREVVNETLRGTGTALRANGVDADALMTAVASPGGLTERALRSFDESGLQAAVERAVATVLGE
ncbi:MAG: NAD(P)-binding domain-containing protein [Thermoleophilaceae bacterium]|nr:NAD(P)-binding domain-containing protein [Thermoleophilaceae bacterium]